LASAGPVAYIGANLPVSIFGTLDLSNGAFTPIAALPNGSGGMAYGPGNLIYNLDASNNLETINPADGSATVIGNIGGTPGYFGLGGSPDQLFASKIAFPPGAYTVSQYNIDSNTAAATFVGTTTGGPNPLGVVWANSSGSFAPYLAVQLYNGTLTAPMGASELYRIDPTTGVGTLIGATGVDGLVALASVDNTLYGITQAFGGGTPGIYTLDTSTGPGTFVANVQGGIDEIYGATATPEPGLVLMPSGLAALLLWRRRRASAR
jgi:hypothetical protein